MVTINVIIIISLGCSFGQPTKKCSSDICNGSVCTNYPNAVCYLDKCANCSPRYFIESNEITNACGKFLLFIINFKQYIIWYTSMFLVYVLIIILTGHFMGESFSTNNIIIGTKYNYLQFQCKNIR